MRLKFTLPKSEVAKVKRLLEQQMQEAVMGLAALQVANIKKRAEQGFDSFDRRMPRYSKAYERYRAKKGREATRRTLTFRGHMFQSMAAFPVGQGRAVIRFADPHQRIKARRNQEIAPFMGISDSDFQKLSQWLKAFLARKR